MRHPRPPEKPRGGIVQEYPTRDEFARLVRDALKHLHDPAYLQTHRLAGLLPADSHARPPGLGRALDATLLDAVEVLRPPAGLSASPRSSLSHEVLRLCFVEGMKAPAVQTRLGIGRTTYYLERDRALEAVASFLWERWIRGDQVSPEVTREPTVLRLATSASPRHNLPCQLTSFVGREREMAGVKGLLETTRLLTLTGAGGCGKTRLAVECARSLLDAFADGVWLVPLASLADPALVPRAVAAALDVQEALGRPIQEALVGYLRTKRLLLIIDNCEHLLDACARLADSLLDACHGLSILATSRQPLGILGETVWHIPSLPIPPAEPPASLEALTACDSVRLFVDRARSASAAFCLSERQASAVAVICRRLDGIPLAIELAAARVRALAPEQIAPRLDHDFNLLTGGSTTALPRQQTLKATLDWSWDLLVEPERQLLRRLSVFAGGFTLEAAEAVCPGGGIELFEVVGLLARLVDRSLVETQVREGDTRYRLLEPIRQYALHRLEESGEIESVRDRHRDWCLELAEEAERELRGPRQRLWLDCLEAEHDNLRAALGWCLEVKPELGLELAARLVWFWDHRCYFHEGYRWLTEALARTSEGATLKARALGLHGAGWLAFTAVQDKNEKRRLLEESLALFRELGERWHIGMTLSRLCLLARNRRDLDLAEKLGEEAVAISRELNDSYLLYTALYERGVVGWVRGDRARARQFLEQSLSAAQECGDPHEIGWGKLTLGQLLMVEHLRPHAKSLLEQALALFREVRYAYGVGRTLCLLVTIAIDEGEYARARTLLQESAAMAGDIGARDDPYLVFIAGILEARRGALESGVRLLGAAEVAMKPLQGMVSEYLWPFYPAYGEAALEVARAALGEEAFARAWAKGQAMTLDQAVEYALT